MARCLIIGCGCRGRMLARELVRAGHAVRGTTRDPRRLPEIEEWGAEAVLADPDRVATLARALDHVTVVCILLGSADGAPDQLAALHGPRLVMLLSRIVDTSVHGVVYEAVGTVDAGLLRAGAAALRAFGEDNHASCGLLEADPGRHGEWRAAAVQAVESVMSGG